MLEKIEVYPYQRVSEPVNRKQRKKKRQIKHGLNGKVILGSVPVNSIKAALTAENLLLGGGALIISRAFVLGELLPFIFAYVVAFSYREKTRVPLLVVFAALGFATVLSGFNLWSNLLALLILVGVINYINILPKKIWWGLPLLAASTLLVAKSLLMLANEVSFYTGMTIVFEAMLTGVLTFVFMVANDDVKQRKPLVDFGFEDIAAMMILGIGIVMGLSDVYLAGLSVSSVLCRLGILIAAFMWGSGGGTMVGVMSGIIPSISSSVFAQSLGLYAVSGLLAGLFRNFDRLGVIIGFMLGTLALSMFISETQAAILGMWETGIACAVFFFLPGNLKERMPAQALGASRNLKETEIQPIDARIKEIVRSRIENLAQVFEELGCSFIDKFALKPETNKTAYLNYLYDEITRSFCENCVRYDSCWGKDCYSTSQEILDIFVLVESCGSVTYEECPADFRQRCIYGREVVSTINYLFDNLRISEYWLERLEESRELVSKQLKGVSRVMKDLAEKIDIKTYVDFKLRDRLIEESRRLGVGIKNCVPIRTNGQLSVNIVAGSCIEGDYCKNNVAPALSSLIGEKMEVYEKKCPGFRGKGQCEFTLTRAFNYKVYTGTAQAGKEPVCGDSFTISTLREGKELIVLSDGMGVGEEAFNESQAAVRLLESLLNSGFDKEVALDTINSVLLLRSTSESFATLDMVIIDLYSGEVDFIKVGAAPSFIKRGKKVGVIMSNSLPIGILNNIDVISEKRVICPRDMLVMVSDGVLEVSRGRDVGSVNWVREFLEDVDETDPQLVAEMITNKALGLCKGKPADDMTVICMYIDLT